MQVLEQPIHKHNCTFKNLKQVFNPETWGHLRILNGSTTADGSAGNCMAIKVAILNI